MWTTPFSAGCSGSSASRSFFRAPGPRTSPFLTVFPQLQRVLIGPHCPRAS